MTKKCRKCGVEKPLTDFNKDCYQKDGYYPSCRECKNAYQRGRDKEEVRANRRGRQERNNEKWAQQKPDRSGLKWCGSCERELPKTEFGIHRNQTDGLKYRCNECEYVANKTYSNKQRKRWDGNENIPLSLDGTKTCSKCGEEKSRADFHRDFGMKDGLTCWCAACRNISSAKANARRLHSNPTARLRSNFSKAIYKGLHRNEGSKAGQSAWKHLPYTPQQLREHLEAQFEDWMTWENYGTSSTKKRTWQIDHIIPHSLFEYDSLEHPDFLKCWSLDNLRPLDALKNIQKFNKVGYL